MTERPFGPERCDVAREQVVRNGIDPDVFAMTCRSLGTLYIDSLMGDAFDRIADEIEEGTPISEEESLRRAEMSSMLDDEVRSNLVHSLQGGDWEFLRDMAKEAERRDLRAPMGVEWRD